MGPQTLLSYRDWKWNCAVEIFQPALGRMPLLLKKSQGHNHKGEKMLAFRLKCFVNSCLEKIWCCHFIVSGPLVSRGICARTQQYLALDQTPPIWHQRTHVLLWWMSRCHLENSFWVVNQNPSRGRKTNGVLGVFLTNDRKATHLAQYVNHSKWGRIQTEQSLGFPAHATSWGWPGLK
jgi:hypothetical protein